MVVVIVGRELAVTGLRGLASAGGQVMGASSLGKVKAVAQNIAIGALLLGFGVKDATADLGDEVDLPERTDRPLGADDVVDRDRGGDHDLDERVDRLGRGDRRFFPHPDENAHREEGDDEDDASVSLRGSVTNVSMRTKQSAVPPTPTHAAPKRFSARPCVNGIKTTAPTAAPNILMLIRMPAGPSASFFPRESRKYVLTSTKEPLKSPFTTRPQKYSQ